jgi:hypothetical protein
MSRPKNAVFIVNCGTWRPVFYHDVPPAIYGGQFFARNLPQHRALVVAQEFNKANLPSKGKFTGKWAVVIKGLRAQPAAAREGLAAAAAARKAEGGAH